MHYRKNTKTKKWDNIQTKESNLYSTREEIIFIIILNDMFDLEIWKILFL